MNIVTVCILLNPIQPHTIPIMRRVRKIVCSSYVRFMRGMFFSCFLTDKHIFSACFYIENNQIIFSVFPNWIKCFLILLAPGARVCTIIILVMHFTEWNIWTIGRFIKKYDFFPFPRDGEFVVCNQFKTETPQLRSRVKNGLNPCTN